MATVELTQLKINRGEARKLIRSPKMRSILLDEADKVAADANSRAGFDGFAAWADDHGVSSHAHVTTTNLHAIHHNIKYNTLTDALMERCH